MATEAGKIQYKTFKDVVAAWDNFDHILPSIKEPYYKLKLLGGEHTIGTPHPDFANEVRGKEGWTVDDTNKAIFLHGSDIAERSAIIDTTMKTIRDLESYASICSITWADELKFLYDHNGEVVSEIERAAINIIGVPSYGVYLIGYFYDENGDMRIWIPRRSVKKVSNPGMLDTTVGGGIGEGLSALKTVLKESEEEASLREADIKDRIKCTGVFHCSNIRNVPIAYGQTDPDFQTHHFIVYIYDLELKPTEKIKPGPGEDHEYEIMSPHQCKMEIVGGQFKPDAASVMTDFLYRHKFITPEEYEGVDEHIHRPFSLPVSREAMDVSKEIGRPIILI